MDNLQSKVIAGGEAKLILTHPQFNAAFTKVRDSIVSQMGDVKLRDKDMHTALIQSLQVLSAVERCLRETVRTGELAKLEIQHQKSLAEQAADIGNRVFSRN